MRASGPPFVDLCKCGWKWASDCKSRPEHCGLVLGMPRYVVETSIVPKTENCGIDDEEKWVTFDFRGAENFPKPKGYEEASKNFKWDEEKENWVKVEEPPVVHTPYEFLPEEPVDLNRVCREVVEDLVKERDKKRTLHDLIGDGGWDHYKEYPDGSSAYMGKSYPEWDSNGFPVFTGWENTEPVTYHKANEAPEQVGGTHYAEMSVQPWDFYKSIFSPAGYCDYHVGSIISYLSRHRKKGEMQDLEKALHHLKEIVRYFKEEAEYE